MKCTLHVRGNALPLDLGHSLPELPEPALIVAAKLKWRLRLQKLLVPVIQS